MSFSQDIVEGMLLKRPSQIEKLQKKYLSFKNNCYNYV